MTRPFHDASRVVHNRRRFNPILDEIASKLFEKHVRRSLNLDQRTSDESR